MLADNIVMKKALSTLTLCVFFLIGAPPAGGLEAPRWDPEVGASFQWQLQGSLDTSFDVDVYDVDMFDTTAGQVADLHDDGRKVICYVSGGSYENWRPDADDFPRTVLGRKLDGWPGERWLDIRKLRKLRPIMNARMDRCRDKGFDGIEFDNVDAYRNRSGFPLTGADQRRYNRYLAEAAHNRDLAVGLKNDLDQVDALEPYFDFALNEQCFQYRECRVLDRFIDAGKPVFHVEYELSRSEFCPRANAHGFSSLKKRYSLRAWRRPC